MLPGLRVPPGGQWEPQLPVLEDTSVTTRQVSGCCFPVLVKTRHLSPYNSKSLRM